jgi:signal peptide peptidase SppA
MLAGNPQQQKQADNAPAKQGATAIIPIVGVLSKYPSMLDDVFGFVSTIQIQNQIDAALYDEEVEKIILFIDSPGGTVPGVPDLADYIATAKTIKPIVAYVSDMCASAAYWLASQCTSIVANEAAFVGSIGVFLVLCDESKAADQHGVKYTLISAGEYKGLEVPGLPIDERAIGESQRQVNSIYQLFCSAVQGGRKIDTNQIRNLADGRIHIASQAIELGLIDAIGTLEVAIQLEDITNMDNEKKADSAPSDDMLKQLLDAINSLSEKLDKQDDDDDEDEGEKDEACDKADDEGSEDESAKAIASEHDRLKAIQHACGNRAEFALNAFLSGKSAVEAKAELADLLEQENSKLRKRVSDEGLEPLALGSNQVSNPEDPEQIWTANINNVQSTYQGKKNYFLAAWKHNKKGNK